MEKLQTFCGEARKSNQNKQAFIDARKRIETGM